MNRLTRESNGKDYYSYARSIELTNEVLERDDKILEPEEFYEKEPYQIDIYADEEKVLIKLGKLEDLEEQLGCPLEVVFKAINKGVKTKAHYDIGSGQEFKEYIEVVEPHLTHTSVELDWLDENKYFQDYANQWCFRFKYYSYVEDKENDEYECLVKLSDYQKTWWLKGEKENE